MIEVLNRRPKWDQYSINAIATPKGMPPKRLRTAHVADGMKKKSVGRPPNSTTTLKTILEGGKELLNSISHYMTKGRGMSSKGNMDIVDAFVVPMMALFSIRQLQAGIDNLEHHVHTCDWIITTGEFTELSPQL